MLLSCNRIFTLFTIDLIFYKMEDIITNAYSVGGVGLALVIGLVSAVKWLYSQFKELNAKIDLLTKEVADLRVESTKYKTLIRSCTHDDCKIKQLLGD